MIFALVMQVCLITVDGGVCMIVVGPDLASEGACDEGAINLASRINASAKSNGFKGGAIRYICKETQEFLG